MFDIFFIIVSALEVNLHAHVDDTGHRVADAEVEAGARGFRVVAVERGEGQEVLAGGEHPDIVE